MSSDVEWWRSSIRSIILSRRNKDLRFGSSVSGDREPSELKAFCSRVNETRVSECRGDAIRLNSLQEADSVVREGKRLASATT